MLRALRTLHLSLPAALVLGLTMSLSAVAQSAPGSAAPEPTTAITPLQFHYMGPSPGGRIASAVGIPGDHTTYYLGAASGGLWKSTDGGHTYVPIFDEQGVAAIGSLAIAATDSNTIWAGTGEPWLIRPSDIIGDGVYKSVDAGKTWKHMGLVETGRISRIVINPRDANNVLVCALGRVSAPQQERGVFRTTDGGATWTRTLFVNDDTGCSGLSMDPNNPDVLFAGTWQVSQRTWLQHSGGPGSGVFTSRDNGVTWTRLARGLPQSPLGKIDVAIAPSNPKRVYALIQTFNQGSLWRSDDGGQQWNLTSSDRSLTGRAGYYIRVAVDPKNPDNVYVANSSPHFSTDGGRTFSGHGGDAKAMGPASCGDCHDVWIDPTNPAHYIVTGDGGASIATGAGNAINVVLPIGQNYHVTSDNQVPYWIYSNRQDFFTMRGPSTLSEPSGNGLLPLRDFMPGGEGSALTSNRRPRPKRDGGLYQTGDPTLLPLLPEMVAPPPGTGLGPYGTQKVPALAVPYGVKIIPPPVWDYSLGGCESGHTLPDPSNSDIVWATCYGNKVTRYSAREGTAHSIEPSRITLDSPPDEVQYRCHWTSPLAIDPFNHNNVFYGCQMVLRTDDEGHSWSEFSPDLSTQDPSRIVSNGGIVGDNLAQYDGEVIWSMAFSPIQRGLLWAGTNDGKLWYTKHGDAKTKPEWIDVTANLKLPTWGNINQISPSSFDPGTAYIVVDYRMAGGNDHKPYILKTSDYGATWKNINGDISSTHPLDYTLSIAENPNKKGMLFVGTGHAFYYTMDDGAHWIKYDKGLPPAPVTWINVEPRFHEVNVSTYGRGLYILPDMTTLEQTGSTAVSEARNTAKSTRLFAPSPIFRQSRGVFPKLNDPIRPHFQFTVASKPTAPVKMEIFDAKGTPVRTEFVTAHQGLNGAYWNLRYDAPKLIELRTTPPDNPRIWEEPRFQGETIRTITHWGITPNTGVPLAAPGDYTVRLTIDGKTYEQPFKLLKDPAIGAPETDLLTSTAMQLRIRGRITETSEMVNQMEIWRKQIEDRVKSDSFTPNAAALQELNKEILRVQHQLVSRESMLSDDKQFPTAYKVYMNLAWLSGGVGDGAADAGGGADYKPTATQIRVLREIEADLDAARAAYKQLQTVTLPAFNQTSAGEAKPISNTLK